MHPPIVSILCLFLAGRALCVSAGILLPPTTQKKKKFFRGRGQQMVRGGVVIEFLFSRMPPIFFDFSCFAGRLRTRRRRRHETREGERQ